MVERVPNGSPAGVLDPAQIVAGFDVSPAPGPIEPLGRGLINETFRVDAGGSGYVLQRINTRVFSDPARIMSNLVRLGEHLREKHLARNGEFGLRIPAAIPARDGSALVLGPDGSAWRMLELIPDALTLTRIETPEQAGEIGRALGCFHRVTGDLPVDAIAVTLAGFHDTPAYLERLLGLSAGIGADAREPGIADLVGFIDARRELASALAAAGLSPRVTHGDPKADNFLFSRSDARVVALIDLDTVQPGLILHDLGDCLRSCCNRVGESPDGAPVAEFELVFCGSLLAAYAGEMGSLLSDEEIDLLFDAIRLLPFELAIRFLADHLDGDRWFKVSHRGQNLHKARVQLALVADIESKADEIRRIIAGAFGPYRRRPSRGGRCGG